MSNCLCIYYSRTGNTRAVMEKIAELLDAELLEITDGKARKGVVGFVAAGIFQLTEGNVKLVLHDDGLKNNEVLMADAVKWVRIE